MSTADSTSAVDRVSARFTVGNPRLRLICLPPAGSGAGAFRAWRPYVPEHMELVPVELPGRGSRIDEPVPDDLDALVEALLHSLEPELDLPYALFGHSFGAVVAYELALRIERAGLRPPSALLASASRAPHLPLMREPVSAGSDDELIAWPLSTGGLPRELLAFPDFLSELLTAVRGDLALAEDYVIPHPVAVSCPLFTFAGEDDTVVPVAQVRPWAAYTPAEHRPRVLPGGHSFPGTHPRQTMSAVLDSLPALR